MDMLLSELPPLYRAMAPMPLRKRRQPQPPAPLPDALADLPPLWSALARSSGRLPAAPAHREVIGRGQGFPHPACLKTGPRFDVEVPPGGYAWWYVDALSDDQRHGLTIIAFVGSVFSPYYLAAGKDRPEDHVAINIALYGGRNRWTMTERGAAQLDRSANHFRVGPSRLDWNGGCLDLHLDERGALFREKVRGRVRIHPEALVSDSFALDPEGRHRWHPIAARARIEVSFEQPGLHWAGNAYLDSNWGAEPMEAGFAAWQWSRHHLPTGAAVFYEGERLDGGRFALALGIDRAGQARPRATPPLAPLRRTGWQMPRAIRSEAPARLLKTWEDAPFYARSAVETRLDGAPALSVHESLSLTRFISAPVQFMLPYRMPRRPD